MAMRETRKLKYLCYILDEYRKPISAEKRNQNSDMLYDYYGASGAIDKIDGYTIDDHVMLIGEDGANLVFRNLPLMYEVNGKAWINNHAHILKPREDVDFYYLFYALENADIFPFVTGSAQPKLNQENLKLIPIPITNYETQKHIASFIKSKCKRIDSLITDIQSQIEALEEYKKSLVFRVVSKGIKKAALKNTVSDVWTAIPENWELIDIKYVFEIVKRIAGQEGFDVLSVTQKGLKVKDIESNNGQQAESYAGYQFVYPTDYVMNHMDLLTGWVDCSTMFGVTSPDYRVFRLRDKENNDLTYFKYVMQCCYMSRIFYSLGQGVSNLGRWRLQTSAFNNFMIPVPPLDEQRKIADYLDTKISEIDIIIAEKKHVTGKKEVVNE